MESLSALNRICQKPNYKKTGNWMVRTFLRDAALPCTWLLLHTPITANQVTLAALIAGLCGAFCLTLEGSANFLWASLLLQLWYYLDHVDGQIARYRKTAGLSGRFFDFFMHHMIHAASVLALGVYFSRELSLGDRGLFAAFGAAYCISLFNMLHDIKSKAFVEHLLSFKSIRIRSAESPNQHGSDGANSTRSKPHFFSVIHKLCEIHVMMNILTVLALIEFIFSPGTNGRILAFILYAPAILLLTLAKTVQFILKKKSEEEFEALFECNVDRS